MFCGNCGRELKENAKFCSGCGKAVVKSDAVSESDTKQVITDEQTELQQPVAESQITEKTANEFEPMADTDAADFESVVEQSEVSEQQNNVQYANQNGDAVNHDNADKQQPLNAPEVNHEIEQQIKPDKIKQPKKKGNVSTCIWSVLVCLFIFVFVVVSSFVVSLKLSITKSNIEKMVKTIDIESIVDDNDEAKKVMGNFTVEEATEIIQTTEVGDYIAEYASNSIEDIKNGRKPDPISSGEIDRLMRENRDDIEKITGYKLVSDDYAKVREYFDENGDALTKSITKDNGTLGFVRVFMSDIFVICIYVFVFLLLLLLYAIRSWKSNTFLWLGITGVLGALSVIVCGLLKSVFVNLVPENAKIYAESFLGTAGLNMMLTGVIVFAVSLFFIVLYVVIRKIKSNIKKA